MKLKWPPKEAQAFSKAIQERFKARTPKGRQDHYIRITDELTGFVLSIPFSSRPKMNDAFNALRQASIPPNMEMISKPKSEEGGYIRE